MGDLVDELPNLFADLGAGFGFVAFSYADGSRTKAALVADEVAVRVEPTRRGSDGIDGDVVTYLVTSDFFASGFSGSGDAVVPGPGQVITPTGEKAWTVDEAESASGEVWLLRCSRRRQRGVS